VIVSGVASVIVNEQNYTLMAGDHIFIKRLENHRVINNGTEPLIFIEVQTGDSFDENDIVRIGDAYNRS
jgi:mannose-6-phosphate isomerase-like protein (cupin superfamily)